MAGADGAIGPAGRAVRDLELLRARLERDVRRALLALNTEDGSDALQGDKASLANAVQVIRQIDRVLMEQGAADFCGGYGCRHSWAPIDAKEAADSGVEILT